ncbi:hypothetical protein [Streptomyces sp. NPDC020983]|uniref:hypothetical protein n=1 Tax=Streptomyces sp. NPDC020983 TaxID=3365106 RepID=UPI0037AA301F
MPEADAITGTSWQRTFPATATDARAARQWAAMHAVHPDARQVAAELYLAVLASRPSLIEMTVSTAGRRRRISASGSGPLVQHGLRGPGGIIIRALSAAHGLTVDERGLWAELTWETQ